MIDRATNDTKAELLVYMRQAEVPASESNRRDSFTGLSERTVLSDGVDRFLRHAALLLPKVGQAARA